MDTPQRPAGIPADFVWNPSGLNGQGAWTKDPSAGDFNTYAQFDSSGKAYTNGNGTGAWQPAGTGNAAFAATTHGGALGGDNMGNWNSLRDNPISNFILGSGPAQQPGVGGPAKDPSKLVQDPTTGMFYDPTTGTSYTDASGQTVVTNPNLAQQVATNFKRASAFLDNLNKLEQERQGIMGEQNGLASTFKDVIAGRGPSAARIQAQIGANNVASQQLAQTAGVSGASAPLAGLMAARNTGQAQIAANNAGALGAAEESKAAMTALTALLNNQTASNAAASQLNAGVGTDLTNTAGTEQSSQQGLNTTAQMKKADDESRFGAGALKSFASLANPTPSAPSA